MKRIRVLLANEPRVYREVLQGALLADSGVEPILGSPDSVDEDVLRLNPDIVVCSRPSRSLDGRERAVVLYPNGADEAQLVTDSVRITVAPVSFEAIRAFITEAARSR